MGTSLTGLTPATTYDALIKVGDNGPIDATLKVLSDGLGNNLPMEASNTTINFTGTLTQSGTTLQPTLVSGTNIKTINGTSLLGSGNIPVVTSPSGVSGAIQFSNGSAFASDASNFFWDNTNKRFGVGTNAPTNNLSVIDSTSGITDGSKGITVGNSNTSNALRFGSYFNIGIISGPSGPLMIQTPASNKGVSISTGYTIPSAMAHIVGSGSTPATTSLLVQNSAGTQTMKLDDSGRLYLDANNYIGATGEWVCSLNFVVNGNINNSNSGYVQLGKAYSLNGLVAGTTTLNASAILEGNSTTKGFLPPRMTTTQKNAIASPVAGLVVYDSTTNKLQCYNGSTWNDLF